MRRIIYLSMSVFAAVPALVAVIATFAYSLVSRLGGLMREALVWAIDYIPRLAKWAKPARRIEMAATALNDRQSSGVRIPGFLGRPAVQMLAG